MEIGKFQAFIQKIQNSLSKAIVGKEDVIRLVTIAFICDGHVLMEDVPGVGKTLLVKAFAKATGMNSKRIQFTPDLLPSDLTGVNIYNQKTGDFEFHPGPLFANCVLADEINRATPRTQSSLLEAMEERQITVDGLTRKLGRFMVLATQNPIDSFGTFPLPEAQLDRFFMRIRMGYPKREEEMDIIRRSQDLIRMERVECAVSEEEIEYVKQNRYSIVVSEDVLGYLMDLIAATRNREHFQLGVSPRGAIALFQASQVSAALRGRKFVIPEDIAEMAPYILSHRIILNGAVQSEDIYAPIQAILKDVTVPTENV